MATSTTSDPKLRPSETVLKVYQHYYLGMQALQKPEVFFNNRTPLEYWADGRLRFNVYVRSARRTARHGGRSIAQR